MIFDKNAPKPKIDESLELDITNTTEKVKKKAKQSNFGLKITN